MKAGVLDGDCEWLCPPRLFLGDSADLVRCRWSVVSAGALDGDCECLWPPWFFGAGFSMVWHDSGTGRLYVMRPARAARRSLALPDQMTQRKGYRARTSTVDEW